MVKDLCGTATYTADKVCHYGKAKSYFTDQRDGKEYTYVEIGTQTWMAENLNYNANGSLCYGDDTGGDSQDKCGTYGRLYKWATAMGGSASSTANPSGVKGVCPSGWHLPSDAEWGILMQFYGFSALPGGVTEKEFGSINFLLSLPCS